MKYTVVIRQPVPDEVRPRLEEQLVERFGLAPEQATRLASRRAGRLMKPTGRPRAELLLRLFQDFGVAVALEEVRDETGVFSEPFQAAPPAPDLPGRLTVGAVIPPVAGAGGPASTPTLTALHDADTARTGEWALPPGLAVPGGGAPGAESARGGVITLAGEDRWADLAAPARVPGEGGGGGGSSSSPFADPFGTPVGGTGVGGTGAGGVGLDPLAGLGLDLPGGRPVTPAAEGPAADSWSDFTGALTITDSAPAPDPGGEAAETYLTAVSEEPRASLGARRSLARQMTFAALAPLALSTTVTLGLLTAIMPNVQRQLVQQNAQAVAVAVGTSLDTRDQETVNTQLDALLRRTTVGFVRVELPDGTTYFRSQQPELDGILQSRVASFLRQNPEQGIFSTSGSAADAYRQQLAQLEAVGAGQSAQAQELRRQAEARENQRSARESYVISRLGVEEAGDGGRTTVAATEDSPDLLYRISVGVSNTEAAVTLRNRLLLVLAMSLLALALAASLAVRAARQVVGPIERLVRAADAISMGDLTRPVQPERNDEIGDLSQALERMRLSLEAAMDRLRRRKRSS